MIAKSYLGLAEAKAIVAAAQAVAVKNGWNVVIAVLDEGGHLQCLERMDGTQLASTYVAQEKGRTGDQRGHGCLAEDGACEWGLHCFSLR